MDATPYNTVRDALNKTDCDNNPVPEVFGYCGIQGFKLELLFAAMSPTLNAMDDEADRP